jgi:hypothetical protein
MLVEAFVLQFPGRSLPVELCEFSFPTQLLESRDVINHPRQQVLVIIRTAGCQAKACSIAQLFPTQLI